MKRIFQPPKLEDQYYDARWLKKHFNVEISEGMIKFLGAVDAAENAYDFVSMRQFYVEHKKENLSSYYFASVDKKHSKWRLPIEMLNENDEVVEPTDNEIEFLKGIKKIRIRGMSEHYGEY